MLKLDGAALDLAGRDFNYTLPEPFGPDRGPAFVKITAKPASSTNIEFRAALDELMHQARVRDMMADKQYKKDDDVDAYLRSRDENQKWVQKAMAEVQYNFCIVKWETNIQSNGEDLKPTRENFIELSQFEHEEIMRLFVEIRQDLTDRNNFNLEAAEQVLEEEAKN